MLLWLTLALLWSSSCWAGQTYGPGGGWYFSTSKDNANEITGIRVCIGAVGIVKRDPLGLGGYKGPHGRWTRHHKNPQCQDSTGQGLLTPQLETMLLWLTLALLWSSTCWAGRAHRAQEGIKGQMEGGPGTIRIPSARTRPQDPPGQGRLTPQLETMLLWLTLTLLWSSTCWADGGKSYELLLQPSEHITRIFGRYRKFIQCLTMYTSRGNKTSFGKEIGKGFFAAASQNRKVLIGVYGQYRLYGLTSIGFLWDYPRGGMTSAQHKSVSSEE
ncbi:hypothetical protein CB1_000144057 [Camelus ferus]|nr:hypothetical protein CB1_000144057 [Camelus ferus]